MKKILVTGGCGYVGSRLVPFLLMKGYQVRVLDSLIFGNYLKNFKFELIKGDIQSEKDIEIAVDGIDTIIHLAAISNDPTAELDTNLTKAVNYHAVIKLAEIAKKSHVKRLILASSSTLYGYQGEDIILNESDTLNPLTIYGKYKAESEKAAFSLADSNFTVSALRPGTVAGYSLRQRLDLIVNIFTNTAFTKNKLRIDGGKQKRPIVNIHDMCRAYELMISAPKEAISKEAFNIVGSNLTIEDIALKVHKIIPTAEIYYKDIIDDRRSYFTSGKKIKDILDFETKFSVEDSIKELLFKFKENTFHDRLENKIYFNIKHLKELYGKNTE